MYPKNWIGFKDLNLRRIVWLSLALVHQNMIRIKIIYKRIDILHISIYAELEAECIRTAFTESN
jgi:hypothetical protein